MIRSNSKVVGQVVIAAALSLGLTAGVTGIASAAKHDPGGATTMIAPKKVAFQGVVTSYALGVLTVVSAKGTTKDFTITATTKILRAVHVKNSVALATGDRVEVLSLKAAPLVATSVNILAPKANKVVTFQGVVTAYVATVSITAKNSKGVSDTFTITATTKILRAANVKHSVTLATGDRVEIRALASTSTVAESINILGAKK